MGCNNQNLCSDLVQHTGPTIGPTCCPDTARQYLASQGLGVWFYRQYKMYGTGLE